MKWNYLCHNIYYDLYKNYYDLNIVLDIDEKILNDFNFDENYLIIITDNLDSLNEINNKIKDFNTEKLNRIILMCLMNRIKQSDILNFSSKNIYTNFLFLEMLDLTLKNLKNTLIDNRGLVFPFQPSSTSFSTS